MTGQTDTVVLTLPAIAWPGTGGHDPRRDDRRGRVRGVHVDLLGPAGLDRRDDLPRRLGTGPASAQHGRPPTPLPDRGGVWAWSLPASLALAAQHRRHQHHGRVGVRARGQHVLPPVPAWDLVDAADAQGAAAGIIVGGLLAIGAIFAGALSAPRAPAVR